MYYVMRASTPSLHRESTDSLINNSFLTLQMKMILLEPLKLKFLLVALLIHSVQH